MPFNIGLLFINDKQWRITLIKNILLGQVFINCWQHESVKKGPKIAP